VELRGVAGCVDPSGVAVTGEVNADERAEGVRVDAVVAVAHDGPVDVPGDDKGQWISCGAERLFYAGGVEEAEGDVERLAKASVGVVVDFSRMHDDADPELPMQAVGARKAGVVVGQELTERGYGTVQQDRLGGLVDGADESEEAITAVGEPVTVAPVDAR